MNATDMEARLQSLERRTRRQGILATGAALAALAAATIAATGPQEISSEVRTKRIVVVNDQGQQAALIAAGKHGGGLVIFDPNGNRSIIAEYQDSGAKLVLIDSRGREFFTAGSGDAGAQITVLDKTGKLRPIALESAK